MELNQLIDFIKKIINVKLTVLGGTVITPLSIFIFLGVFALLFICSRLFIRLVAKKILDRLSIEKGLHFSIIRVIKYSLLILSLLFSLQFIGVSITGIAIMFGFLSVGIGFGLRNITSNFISGIIMLFERPIKVGDRVTVEGFEGIVTDIKIRATTVQTLGERTIIIPNSYFIESHVLNWSHLDKRVRVDIMVGVSYSADVDLVEKTLMEIAYKNQYILNVPAPRVLFLNLGDSSLDFKLYAWVSEHTVYYSALSSLHFEIIKKFRELDIEIPFPQRDLHLRSSFESQKALAD
ncbi:MAG: mechanosensitive ion channel [Deltaproteobacteria bacterium]|nr:mechanosensitive ion channel [Deltaproteobacteria bacterium]